MNVLSQIQIIMVNTTLPANIGSAARAMHTMGFSHLTVIDPKYPIDDTSYAHAAGATHLLDAIKIVPTLEEAIADSQLVFAASSRSRTMPRPVVNPTAAAAIMDGFIKSANQVSSHISSQTSSQTPTISIIFGREDRGLTNEELAVADYHIQIDANPDYPVLNVASAVQVITGFIYSHFYHHGNDDTQASATYNDDIAIMANTTHHAVQAESSQPLITHHIRQQWDAPPISQQQQQQLNERLIELMQSLDLADTQDLKLLPQRLSRLTSRLQLDNKEYQLISAIIGKLNKQTNSLKEAQS